MTVVPTAKKDDTAGAEGGGGEGSQSTPASPDGGWGWMVVLGSFMIHVLADGMAYSYGVYVDALVEEFGASHSQVGGLGSLLMGCTWCTGPLASMLVNKYGCRAVTILGTAIAAFGFIVSIFSPNIYFMYFSFGIVAAIGLGMAYLPAIVAVSYYFEKRRSFATGLAVCGSGVGTFIFAPLTEHLVDEYGWKGSLLIETGILLNCFLCGAVFRPLRAPRPVDPPAAADPEPCAVDEIEMSIRFKEKVLGAEGLSARPGRGSRSGSVSAVQEAGAPASPPLGSPDSAAPNGNGIGAAKATSLLAVNANANAASSTLSLKAAPNASTQNVNMGSRTGSRRSVHAGSTRNLNPLDRKDIFYTASLKNIPIYVSNPDLFRRGVVSAPPQDQATVGAATKGSDGVKEEEEASSPPSKLMDWSLMCDIPFELFAWSNLLTSIGLCVPYVFLPDRGVKLDMTSKQGAMLVSVMGIANTVGRIVFGFLADFKWVNRLMLYNTVLVLCGIASVLSALCITFPTMSLYAAVFGLLIGVYICLTPIVLVDLLGLEKLSNAFGIVLFFQGVGGVIGAPIAGMMYDISKDYNDSFYFMGACVFVSGAMLYPIPAIQRCLKRRVTANEVAWGKKVVSDPIADQSDEQKEMLEVI